MATRRPKTKPLRFLFYGQLRDWRPLKGHTPPKGRVCELVSFPGNVVTWASTLEEALDKQRRALERGFKLTGSAVKWYDNAMKTLTEEQENFLDKLWVRVFKEQRPMETAMLPDDVSHVVLHSDTYHAEEPDESPEPEADHYEFAYFVEDKVRDGELCPA